MRKIATCFAAALLLAAPAFAADPPPDPRCWISYCDPPVFPPDPPACPAAPPEACQPPLPEGCEMPPECDPGAGG